MSKENFQYWKELVGLEDTDFPQLIQLEEDEIERASIVPTRMMPIKNAIAANVLVDVQVQPGWGATTLFRYLARELKRDNLTLLVQYDFEKDKLKDELTEDEFSFSTKWEMARELAKRMRDNPMQPIYMYEVMSFEDTGESPWTGHLRQKMRALESCKNDPERFYAELPFFERFSVDECVNYFLANFQMRTVFLYLFPRKVDEDALYAFVGIIKNLYDGKKIQPAAMREVYIGVPKLFKQMKAVYARPYYDIPYKRYSAGEIYSMLVSTYKIQDAGASGVSDVLDEGFINAMYNEKAELNRIMGKVTQAIQDTLEGDTADIPYKLFYSSGKGEDR